MLSRHELTTARTTAGKRGLFTGFLGNIELMLTRRERGESLVAIADDLERPYDSVKTYSKLANRALRTGEISR